MSEQIENLAEGLAREIKRCRELLKQYEDLIGTPGVNVTFAISHLLPSIEAAEASQTSNDVVAMLRCFKDLESKA